MQEDLIHDLIMRQKNKREFDVRLLESISEQPVLKNVIVARKIQPMIATYGILYITNENIYFQPFQKLSSKQVEIWSIKRISKIFKRRYELTSVFPFKIPFITPSQIGIEFIIKKRKSEQAYFFALLNNEQRDEVMKAIKKNVREEVFRE